MFDPEFITDELEKNAITLHTLLLCSNPIEPLFKPAPDKWCLLEIVCHLYDEEREDFRARIQHVLEQTTEKITPVEPLAWITERKYITRDYEKQLQEFLNERAASVKWLRNLQNPDWNLFYQHPKLGKLSARLFLCNWLAHDYHHIRQILSVKHAWLHSEGNEPLSYAGKW